MRRFRLLKDLPSIPAGTVLRQSTVVGVEYLYKEDLNALEKLQCAEHRNAVRAEAVAFIMKVYCPKGQDVPYETLEKLYQNLRGIK